MSSTVVCLLSLSAVCNVDSMLFFPSASEQNYVTFSLSLPNLPELSMCLWLRVDTSHVGTLLSYATHDNDNQLVLYGRNSSVSWHHLCVVWSSIQGRFWHYNNRRLASTGSDFRKGWEIPGGGSVVLGQEQDSVGGGFDRAEGFAGQMAGFRIWDRVLSPSEVEGVAEGRGVPRGVVLGMEDIKQVHGEVQQVACECLEHCL
uniref:Pentraxin (PTX) domain-containing protein n=1 Tax=Sphaeramia orbicularis TaxID=375764 RepID=A0A672YKH0_9TELE